MHSAYTKPKTWSADSGDGLKTPVCKESAGHYRSCGLMKMVSFHSNTLLTFESGKKGLSPYTHYENNENWIKIKLVFFRTLYCVTDKALYHNVQLYPQLNSSS